MFRFGGTLQIQFHSAMEAVSLNPPYATVKTRFPWRTTKEGEKIGGCFFETLTGGATSSSCNMTNNKKSEEGGREETEALVLWPLA